MLSSLKHTRYHLNKRFADVKISPSHESVCPTCRWRKRTRNTSHPGRPHYGICVGHWTHEGIRYTVFAPLCPQCPGKEQDLLPRLAMPTPLLESNDSRPMLHQLRLPSLYLFHLLCLVIEGSTQTVMVLHSFLSLMTALFQVLPVLYHA